MRNAPPPAAPRRSRDGRWALLIAAALCASYGANRDFLVGSDAVGNVFVAANLVEDGRLSFTPTRDPAHFEWMLRPPDGQPVDGILSGDTLLGGVRAADLWSRGLLVPTSSYYHLTPSRRSDPATGEPVFVNTFGPGAGIAAAPVLAAVRLFAGDLRRHPEALWYGAKLAASLLVAASAAFVFLAARAWLSPALAALVALGYGLGTCVFSVSSQALWQHPAAECFLALGALLLVRAVGVAPVGAALRERWWYAGAGAAFACAAACRPPDAVFALAVAGWLAVVRPRALAAYLAGAAPFAAALAAYNAYFFGAPWSFGQTAAGPAIALSKTGSPDLWQTPLLTGLAGTLLSPSRGLLVYSPVLGLGLAGAALAWRRAGWAPLRPLAVGAALLLLVESKWFDWWGGWAYGYRRVVDLAPILALLAAPALGWIVAARWRRAVFGGLLAWSVLVQVVGAFAYEPRGWNARREGPAGPAQLAQDIDDPRYRGRLWSWSDAQIPYYLAHFAAARAEREELVRTSIDRWRPGPGE
ncbi:hypothetical protein [Anaeromyxobacter diazotrophicus]|nr:hypothetical protein [Anaeromyxobacter diazotrophicus]